MIETPEQRRIREHEEDLERLRNFRPMDDDFMRCLFKDNLPLVQFVLRIILDNNELVITHCETQFDMKRVTGARSICLDAYGTDPANNKYDIEIQRADTGATPKRARYHSSVMDIENLDAGEAFDRLPETFTIFITERDVMGHGKSLYRFDRLDIDDGTPLRDGSHIVYVNGEYKGIDNIGKLIHDMNCSNAADMNFELMAKRTRYLKEDPEGVRYMCKSMEDMRNKAWEDGRAEGKAEGRVEGKAEGEKNVTRLIRMLLSLGKTDDVNRVISGDEEFTHRLMEEYAI